MSRAGLPQESSERWSVRTVKALEVPYRHLSVTSETHTETHPGNSWISSHCECLKYLRNIFILACGFSTECVLQSVTTEQGGSASAWQKKWPSNQVCVINVTKH